MLLEREAESNFKKDSKAIDRDPFRSTGLPSLSDRMPTAFRQTVIIHMLLRLIVPNFGRLFKNAMGAFPP